MPAPAMMEVELPNGTILEVPEGTPPEQINNAWLKIQRNDAAATEEVKKGIAAQGDNATAPFTHGVKYAGQKLLKGLTSFPTMMLDAIVPRHPAQEEWSTEVDRLGTRPATRGQRYIGAAAEGVGAVAAGGPAAFERPLLSAVQGMSGGAGAEAAVDIGGEGPLQRLAGSLVGTTLPTLPYAFTGHKEDLAKIALRGVDPAALKRGVRTQHEGLDEGLRLTLSQAMDQPSNIDRIAAELMNMEAGTRTQQAVRAQPVQATAATQKHLLKLPGDVTSQRGAANLAQDASTEAIKQAQKVRRAAFEEIYEKGARPPKEDPQVVAYLDKTTKELDSLISRDMGADLSGRELLEIQPGSWDDLIDGMSGGKTPEQMARFFILKAAKPGTKLTGTKNLHGGEVRLPTKVIEGIDARLNQLQRQYPNQGVADSIGDLREALRNNRLPSQDLMRLVDDIEVPRTPEASRQGGQWINQVEELAGILRSQKAQLKGPSLKAKPLSAEEAAKFKQALDIVKEELETYSPKYKAANAKYRELSTSTVNPLKKSVVGDLAGKGANEIDPAAKTKAFSIFDAGTIPGHTKTSDILTLEREWRKAGRGEDFATVAKSWLADRIASATKASGDRKDPMTAKALYDAIAGDAKQKQGLRDILVGMAKSQGIDDEQQYAEGFMGFMRVLGAAARRPGESSRLPGEVVEQVGQNPVSWFLKLFSIVPFSEAAGAAKRLYSQKAFAVMDELMTSPDGVAKLKQLAREPVMSKKAQTIVNSLLIAAATAQGEGPALAKEPEMRATPPRGPRVLPTDLPYFPGMTEAR